MKNSLEGYFLGVCGAVCGGAKVVPYIRATVIDDGGFEGAVAVAQMDQRLKSQ